MAHLTDDGTLDTVVVCDTCGREHRFNFEPSWYVSEDEAAAEYDAFTDECIADVNETCECHEGEK